MSAVGTASPRSGSSGRAIGGTFAHATWREPGPWQASQPTSMSVQRGARRSRSPGRSPSAGWWSGTRRTSRSSSGHCGSSAASPRPGCPGRDRGGTSAAARRPRPGRAPAAGRPGTGPGTAAAARSPKMYATSYSAIAPPGPSVRPECLPSRRKKREVTPWKLNVDVVEVALDRLLGRLGHRKVVVGAPPRLAGRLVALGAGGAADKGRGGVGGGRPPPGPHRAAATAGSSPRSRASAASPTAPSGASAGSATTAAARAHELTTCDASKAVRCSWPAVSTLTTPFSIRTG